MFGEKKLEVNESANSLTISYRWFTPIAIFMLFFTIAWDAFLVFWYGIGIATGGPWIMFLFPIIHVAVGVWLTYSTICSLMNKTIIHADYGQLSIVHMPVPWWRGNKKYQLDEIKQFYVKEHVGNKGSRSYKLRAKMTDDRDLVILDSASTGSETFLKIEEKLERFLGIEDRPVKGEYGKTSGPAKLGPRRRRKSFDSDKALLNFKVGNEYFFKGDYRVVNHKSQYDWENGNSDTLVQMVDDQQKETLIYIRQNKGMEQPFQEKKLSLFETNDIQFNEHAAPKSLNIKGVVFYIDDFTAGLAFLSENGTPIKAKNWFYKEKKGENYLRIEANSSIFSFFVGKKIPLTDFEPQEGDILDLEDPTPEYRKNDYEDFFEG